MTELIKDKESYRSNTEALETEKLVYQSKLDTIRFYEMNYSGESCYCILHTPSDSIFAFEHDKIILKCLTNKAKQNRIAVNQMKNGRYTVEVTKGKRGHCISLRQFLYAKYNSLPLEKVRGARIGMLDESAIASSMYDFRKCNLYMMRNQSGKISIECRPMNPDERYIVIRDKGRIEIQEYSEELYNILTGVVSVWYDETTKRESVHLNRDGTGTRKLGRFVLMFNKHFGQYKNVNGGANRFINALINNQFSDCLLDCGHINAETWNNSKYNIMPMESKTNIAMSNLIKRFKGKYGANAIVINDGTNDIILIELINNGHSFYFRCYSPEDYCDLQIQLIGKSGVTGGTRIRRHNLVEGTVTEIPTPIQSYEYSKACKEEVQDVPILEQFWTWCDKRDELVRLYAEKQNKFFLWKKWKQKGVNVIQSLKIAEFFGAGLF